MLSSILAMALIFLVAELALELMIVAWRQYRKLLEWFDSEVMGERGENQD